MTRLQSETGVLGGVRIERVAIGEGFHISACSVVTCLYNVELNI